MSDNEGGYKPVKKAPPAGHLFDEHGNLTPVVEPDVYGPDFATIDFIPTCPFQAAALRYLMHQEARPMSVVAAECGKSQQALSNLVMHLYKRFAFPRTRKRRTAKS